MMFCCVPLCTYILIFKKFCITIYSCHIPVPVSVHHKRACYYVFDLKLVKYMLYY